MKPQPPIGDPPYPERVEIRHDTCSETMMSQTCDIIETTGDHDRKFFSAIRYRTFAGPHTLRFEARFEPVSPHNPTAPEQGMGIKNRIDLTLDVERNVASLGPKGNIIIDMPYRNRGIGRYMLSRVLTWLQVKAPSASINPGWLSPVDGGSNHIGRDRFYRSQGFRIHESEHTPESGTFWIENASLLTPSYNDNKVTVMDPRSIAVTLAANALQIENISFESAHRLKTIHAQRTLISRYQRIAIWLVWSLILIGVVFYLLRHR